MEAPTALRFMASSCRSGAGSGSGRSTLFSIGAGATTGTGGSSIGCGIEWTRMGAGCRSSGVGLRARAPNRRTRKASGQNRFMVDWTPGLPARMLGNQPAAGLLAPEDRGLAVRMFALVIAGLRLGLGAAVAPVAERPLLVEAVGQVLEIAARVVVDVRRMDHGPHAVVFDVGARGAGDGEHQERRDRQVLHRIMDEDSSTIPGRETIFSPSAPAWA